MPRHDAIVPYNSAHMSLLVRRFADFLHDLQQLERTAAHGDAILDAFTRHTPFLSGAVYLRDRDANLRLAAKSNQFVAPEILADEPPTELVTVADRVLVPLRSGRDHLGLLVLAGGEYSEEDLDLLRAAAAFVGTLMANQRLSQEAREGDFQLKYRLWELESLYDIGLSIAGTLNIEELADEVLFRMISLINARRAALFLRDGDVFKPYRSFGDVPVSEEHLQRMLDTANGISLEGGTVVAVPVNGNNQIIGVLAAADRETRDGGVGAFESSDLDLVLRTIREEKGFSQLKLAKKSDVPQSYISELEAGLKKNPGIETLKKLARALGVPVSELLE